MDCLCHSPAVSLTQAPQGGDCVPPLLGGGGGNKFISKPCLVLYQLSPLGRIWGGCDLGVPFHWFSAVLLVQVWDYVLDDACILPDSCKKVGLVFSDVVSCLEVVNCQSVQAQVSATLAISGQKSVSSVPHARTVLYGSLFCCKHFVKQITTKRTGRFAWSLCFCVPCHILSFKMFCRWQVRCQRCP